MRLPARSVVVAVSIAAFVAPIATTANAAPSTQHSAAAAAKPMSSLLAENGQVKQSSAHIGDIYPSKWRNVAQDSVVDDWNMYNRECVSWAAFIVARHGQSANNYGDAKYWDDNARRDGYKVDNNPTAGSVAQTDNGQYGHVAVVESVSGTSVTVEDYNWAGDGHYLEHTINRGDFRYIHFFN